MSDAFNSAEEFVTAPVRHDASARPARPLAGPAGKRMTTTSLDGLPLRMRDGAPVAPDASFARGVQLGLKRVLLDIPLSLAALLVLAPLLIVVAIMVRVNSPGPSFFKQERVGLNNRTFRMLKFRTMRTDSCDASGLAQVTAGDARVTSFGRFLRNTSIDELPQLWNILVGDMSIIGPRPMVPGMQAAGVDYRDVVPYYDFRHLVKPGLSGWAQANGLRGPTTDIASAKERIDYDCAYVQNVSVLLDIRTIYRTIVREFLTGSGV